MLFFRYTNYKIVINLSGVAKQKKIILKRMLVAKIPLIIHLEKMHSIIVHDIL
jgi:hypothetical protein